jgi:hypothetical protein
MGSVNVLLLAFAVTLIAGSLQYLSGDYAMADSMATISWASLSVALILALFKPGKSGKNGKGKGHGSETR